MAQLVKNPPTMPETWVRSLGWEDSPGGGRQTESFGKHNCGNNAPSTMSRHRKLYAERGLESVTVLALLILSRGWGGGASFKNEKLVLKKRLALFIFFVK